MNRPSCISQNIALADKNWFKTGGAAEYFAAPQNDTDALDALSWAHQNKIPITIIGHGANILISDEGIKGLVIIAQTKKIFHHEALLTVDAGVSIDETISYALGHNLGGLEFFTSIPGSMGGAVCMNIHYFDALLSDYIKTVRMIDMQTMQILEVDASWCNFGYNKSKFLEKRYLILSVILKLTPLTSIQTAYAQGRSDEIKRQRSRRYPPERTCGSFFQNFSEAEYQHAKGNTQVPYVAYYLESVGVKGQLSVGKASVFHLHANMLVSKEGATSQDICSLARTMQEKVYEKFNLWPKPECQLLGFTQNPLLPPISK